MRWTRILTEVARRKTAPARRFALAPPLVPSRRRGCPTAGFGRFEGSVAGNHATLATGTLATGWVRGAGAATARGALLVVVGLL